jgi:CRISPR-associated endonuclease/helicase Cas3
MLAKSNGLTLKEHSEIVNEYASKLFAKTINDNELQYRYYDVIKYSSLLHDIGKLTTNFQEYLKGKRKNTGLKFSHNEIGWAFLSKYLNDDFLGVKNREMMLNIVYWHHGINPKNKMGNHTDSEILSSLDEKSINNMLEYLEECKYVDMFQINPNPDFSDAHLSPKFYPDDKILNKERPMLNLLRSIVISADRNSSEFTDINMIDDNLIDSFMNMSEQIEIKNTKFDGSERFENQKQIVNSIEEGKTTIIKAPAGFGKTLLGVMWGFKSNKKVIWVLPKNNMSVSVYNSILEEFSNLNTSTSVQLILSGEIKETNDNSLGIYESNIIVTNIDNFLSPNFKNNIMNISSLLFGADVIFDEYHDLISDAPYFSLFVEIMKARNIYTNSSTLLLSATPTNIHKMWEHNLIPHSKTNILPNKDTHFSPVHNKPYVVKIHNTKINPEPNTNTLVIKNTLKSAQEEKRENDYKLLMHSSFTEEHKDYRYKILMNEYGKKSDVNNEKPNIIGTHVLQASFDISFNHLIEDIISPESTLQRFGRVNRWGELEIATVDIVKDIGGSNERGEIAIKNIMYNRNLSDMWFDYLIKNLKGKETLTLIDLYNMYNKYYNDNNETLYKHFESQLRESAKLLSKIHPIKTKKDKKDDNVKTAGSNKLRSVNSEIFYIIQHENDKDWIGPFTKQMLKSFDEEFNEDSNVNKRMIKTMVKLRNNNDQRFDFNDFIDKKNYITIDSIRRGAIKSNTPYIVYNAYYSDELGILKQ